MTRFRLYALHHPQLSMCSLKESNKARKQLRALFEFTSRQRQPQSKCLCRIAVFIQFVSKSQTNISLYTRGSFNQNSLRRKNQLHVFFS